MASSAMNKSANVSKRNSRAIQSKRNSDMFMVDTGFKIKDNMKASFGVSF